MKNINQYIVEKFKVSSKNINKYNYHPKTKDELLKLLNKLIIERGDDANLNDIDTSEITDMNVLFSLDRKKFNGDISKWNTSKVTTMFFMFCDSEFNGDISSWDVSKVENMNNMFDNSKFNGDINDWNVKNVKYMRDMFYRCPLEKNPPKWYKDE